MAAVCASAPASHLQRLNGTRRFGERRPPSRADSAPAGAGADVSGRPTLIMAKGQAVAPKATTLYQTCCTTINRSRAPSSSPTAAPRVSGRVTRHDGWIPYVVARSTSSRPRLSSSRPAARQRTSSNSLARTSRPGRGVARGFATRLRAPSGPCGSVARV